MSRGRSWQRSRAISNLAELERWSAAVVFDVLELKLLVSAEVSSGSGYSLHGQIWRERVYFSLFA